MESARGLNEARETLRAHARKWLGERVFDVARSDYWLDEGDDAGSPSLFESWLFYDWIPGDEKHTVAGHWLSATEEKPSRDHGVRRFVQSANESALSFYQLDSFDDESAVFRDILTRERSRAVGAKVANAAPGTLFIGRLVELGGEKLVDALRPARIAPERIAEWLDDNLDRHIPVPRAELRRLGNELVECLSELIEGGDRANGENLVFFTTDGELFVACRETFRIAEGARAKVIESLGKLSVEKLGDPSAIPTRFSWVERRVDGSPGLVLGELLVDAEVLVIEAKSRERRDRIKAELLAQLAGHLAPVSSEEQSQEDLLSTNEDDIDRAIADALPIELTKDTLGDHLAAHYAKWPDMPLEALGGRSPRVAVRSAKGRRKVESLISDMERRSRGPMEDAFDFDSLRRKLGLETGRTGR